MRAPTFVLSLVSLLSIVLASATIARAEEPTGSARVEAQRVLAKFAREPSVLDVQGAAARFAKVNPGFYDGWVAQSHLAYILPNTLQGRIRNTADDNRDLRTTSSGTGSLSDLVSNGDQTQLELRVGWDLTRLVYNRDSIAASRQIERIVNQREDLLTTVNKLFFARRQLQVDMLLEPANSIERAIKQQLRLDGLTADLDALTGGWFSKQLAAATPAP